MSKILSFCMYFLSFTPLWLTVLFIDAKSLSEGGENKYTEIISIILVLAITVISITLLVYEFHSLRKSGGEAYELREACESKTITAEFLLSYILPLFAFDFRVWDQVVEFLIFFLILAYLCIRHNYFSVNIILEIMGYKMYKCTLNNSDNVLKDKIVISKRTLTVSKGKEIHLRSINNDFGLDVKNGGK